MKRVVLPLLLVLAFIAIAVVATVTKRPAEAQRLVCADPVIGCAFTHRGMPARLRFLQAPAPLKPFGLEIFAPGAQRVGVETQMAGMDMGFNRYALRAVTPGMFSTQITLAACVSGQRDWKLYVDLDGQRYVLPFKTQ